VASPTTCTNKVGLILAAIAWAAVGVTAVKAEVGAWSTEDTIFTQVNVFCIRNYICGPAEDVLYSADQRIVSTSSKPVRGVCSADGGPADSCNVCLTNPPTEKCEWHLSPNK
jgi:hypothetical protein